MAISPRAIPAFPASFLRFFSGALSAWTRPTGQGRIDARAQGAAGAGVGTVLDRSAEMLRRIIGGPAFVLKSGTGFQLRDWGPVPGVECLEKMVLERMRMGVDMYRTLRIR